MKLTKKVLEALKPTGKRYDVTDDELPGFVVRVGTSGARSFGYRYRSGKGRVGASSRIYIGEFPAVTVEQARAIAKRYAAVVALGEDPAESLRQGKKVLTVADAAKLYLEEHVENLKPSSQVSYRRLFRLYILPRLGKVKIDAVTTRALSQFHHAMKGTPYAANRSLAVLSGLFVWCEANGYREKGSNPCKGVERFREQKKMDFLSEGELAAIGDALNQMEATWHERQRTKTTRKAGTPRDSITPQSAAILRMLMLTGARCGEVLTLKWEYIDAEKGIANLPDSKTGFKVLQLSDEALAVLEGLPQVSEYVFPAGGDDCKVGYQTNIKDPWRDVLRCAGLEGKGWRIHDLRHAFASVLVNAGASLPLIGKLLGHASTITTARYAHVAANPAREAAKVASNRIVDAINKRPKAKVIPFRQTANQ